MIAWGVYILKGDRYYVGSTNDRERRLQEHREGKTHTTKRIGEWQLIRWIECNSEHEARSLERRIKKNGHYERWANGSFEYSAVQPS